MKKVIQNNAIANLFSSIIFIIIGIIFVTNPKGVLDIISYIIGGALLLFGAMQIITYFKIDTQKNNFINTTLLIGIISIALALIIIIFSSVFETLIRIIIAFIIIYNGVIKMKTSIDLKHSNVKEWIYMFSISLITILCGLYILTKQGFVFITIGIVTIVYGILDLIQNIIYIKNINTIIKK